MQQAYDDMMMANLELTSSEYESPNYTLVFTRKQTEVMPQFSEKHKADIERVSPNNEVLKDPSPYTRSEMENVRTKAL